MTAVDIKQENVIKEIRVWTKQHGEDRFKAVNAANELNQTIFYEYFSYGLKICIYKLNTSILTFEKVYSLDQVEEVSFIYYKSPQKHD